MNFNKTKKITSANTPEERGQRLIEKGFRPYLTIPNAWVRSINVPFVWHGFGWSTALPEETLDTDLPLTAEN